MLTCFLIHCSDHAAKDDAAFVESVVPPQNENVEEGVKVAADVSAQQLFVELAAAVERQTELVAQLKTRYVGESITIAQKDEEISLLRAQLAEAQAETEFAKAHADKVTDEKLAMMCELQHAWGELHQFRANLTWG